MRLVRASVRLLATALVACAASGCFINEIDKAVEANQFMGPKGAEAPAGAPAGAEPKTEPKKVAAAKPEGPKGASWWKTASSLTSEDSQADIVACKLKKGVDFMTRDDCLARGGVTQ
jgi:hypothetical protein